MQTDLNRVQSKLRALAFYLPQFHPIAENDQWWGPGFTEWRNVVQARPKFPGHYQPHLPADLGFYDLRLPEARQAQADLASSYGLNGFCYYHYWFNGRRLLERPFADVLSSGQPNFPFCLCWANESWTRTWDGRYGEHLITQQYSEADDLEHIRWLIAAFSDSRYVRVDDKPLFLIYRARQLPDPRRTAELWRAEARRAGLPGVFLCQVESNFVEEHADPAKIGFDAAVEFQPDVFHLPAQLRQGRLWRWLTRLRLSAPGYQANHVFDYAELMAQMLDKPAASYQRFRCVTPGWDNSARRQQHAYILGNSTPELYEHWLASLAQQSASNAGEERLIFINAWNEWAEGSHLEPDQRFGRAYLEATRRALQTIN